MRNIKICLSILSFIIFNLINCEGQNYIYGIRNNGAYFSKYDITNNSYTDLHAVPSTFPGALSSCTDYINSIYYLSTGNVLYGFNLNNGNIVTNYTLSMPGVLYSIQFNSCDTNIYGLLNGSTSIQLARINPSTNTMSIVFNQSYPAGFCMGCLGFIDPTSQVYTLYMGGAILGIDINNGQIVYNSPIINIASESFGHICLHCSTHTIYGTSANINAGIKYLATIDPYTGIVTHIPGSVGWNGVWKPASAGATIDQSNSIYYYIAAGNLLNGINLFSGNLQSSQTNIPDINFIQHVPQCSCVNTGLIDNINDSYLTMAPNPFSNKLNISVNGTEQLEVSLYDVTSRKIFNQSFNNSISINTEQLAKGIYLYEVRNKSGVIKKGKVVKD